MYLVISSCLSRVCLGINIDIYITIYVLATSRLIEISWLVERSSGCQNMGPSIGTAKNQTSL